MRQRLVLTAALAAAVIVMLPEAAPASQTHVVQLGETLWSVAARYRVSVEIFATANGIENRHLLGFGQTLMIPDRVAGPLEAARHPRTMPAKGRSARVIPSRGMKWAAGVIATAARYVGVRYRWGGISPAGFDCSGFIGYVLRSMSVAVPRTTYAMWMQGAPVPRDQLRVGDIVFFSTTRPGPSHAGIYIGNNQFVHASSGFGRVDVTSLDYRYYTLRYLGARRF